MHSLSELKAFLESKQIQIKSYNGWQIVIGNDTWGMSNDVIYCNKDPVTKKEILNRANRSLEEGNKNGETRSEI